MLRHLPHGTQTVRSSATYRGDPAPHQAYLTEVSFTNVQYKVVKIREGRGKNTTTRDLARVTGDFRILASSTVRRNRLLKITGDNAFTSQNPPIC